MGPPPGGGMGMGGAPGAGGPPHGGDDRHGPSQPHGGYGSVPRQTLSITFSNTGATPVTFTITELNSLVGNFAPQPERITLAPGASESLQPVSGDAGGLLNWLDVTLTLRRADTVETQVLHLIPTGEPIALPLPPPDTKRR